ncbi:MAG: helix-turn-helix domain-containing protein [Streptococcus sp.]|uniref:helix-turn-helix domain-containing protein n=1 Tax=Streptococcus sp. TaxID=1306 RepID=UPI0025E009F0|nr:helix-turn-helix domain-containing protein [Streptococcus sp.]MBS7138425.1 helix-turn-helix domain-containing protein [Streptococcus sp.]
MNRIKELRKSKNGGMTQQELAEAVSIPKRTIQRLENNESQIKPDKAQILADYFGVDVPYLLGYSDNPLGALDDLAKELDQHLSKAEKEDIKKHPELTQHYLALAWDRMRLNPEDIKPVKITPHNSALSDEELMKLPKEERQKYIKEQFKNLEVQIASVNEKLSVLSKISTESLVKLSSEQLNRLTTDLIQALAKVNEVNKNN